MAKTKDLIKQTYQTLTIEIPGELYIKVLVKWKETSLGRADKGTKC
jgi:hypothetical protein